MVGIVVRLIWDHEQAITSEAMSVPYCSAIWLVAKHQRLNGNTLGRWLRKHLA